MAALSKAMAGSSWMIIGLKSCHLKFLRGDLWEEPCAIRRSSSRHWKLSWPSPPKKYGRRALWFRTPGFESPSPTSMSCLDRQRAGTMCCAGSCVAWCRSGWRSLGSGRLSYHRSPEKGTREECSWVSVSSSFSINSRRCSASKVSMSDRSPMKACPCCRRSRPRSATWSSV